MAATVRVYYDGTAYAVARNTSGQYLLMSGGSAGTFQSHQSGNTALYKLTLSAPGSAEEHTLEGNLPALAATTAVEVDIVVYDAATDDVIGSETRVVKADDTFAGATVDGKSQQEAFQVIAAMVGGKVSGANTGTEIFVGLDGVTTRATVTVSDIGNRTAVTYA